MKHIMKAAIVSLSLLGLVNSTFAADATSIKHPTVNSALQSYMLAQGTVYGTGMLQTPSTNKRCAKGTNPTLTTSIVRTEQNNIAAVQGIVNTLQLNPSNYVIYGGLYMPNQAVSNSYAIANWQIWCQPTATA
ncbi:MAG TPA: hypothetical protein VL360_01265 [Gammaproteobacteria bacterium]|jgi:hypothetical protein|nr:hypothetical protein [Gammaproteobacteria bacterium]